MFSHSMNYRSVVAFGEAKAISDKDKKLAAFKALLDHMIPGRWDDTKQPDDIEIAATTDVGPGALVIGNSRMGEDHY